MYPPETWTVKDDFMNVRQCGDSSWPGRSATRVKGTQVCHLKVGVTGIQAHVVLRIS